MRFALVSLAALPLLAAAEQDASPGGSWGDKARHVVARIVSYMPDPSIHHPAPALEAKLGPLKLSTLTLDSWKETLEEAPVQAHHSLPDRPPDWWVLVTGGNKTCFGGRCNKIEQAFNETARRFASTPGSPRMAILNCDLQPILCHSWAAAAGSLWAFSVRTPPSPVDIYIKKLNLTTTTTEDLISLEADQSKQGWRQLTSPLHPFDGKLAELGLSVAFGHASWALSRIPSWFVILAVSVSTRMLLRRRLDSMIMPDKDVGVGVRLAPRPRKKSSRSQSSSG